jgi:hypothetical protein
MLLTQVSISNLQERRGKRSFNIVFVDGFDECVVRNNSLGILYSGKTNDKNIKAATHYRTESTFSLGP